MNRISCAVLAITILQGVAVADTLNPGDQMIATFTATPNTADILDYFNNDPLTITGSPVITTSLYDGSTLLGTHTASPFAFAGQFFFVITFAAPGGGSGAAMYSPTTVDFTSIHNGTINGRLVTTVSGGSVSGFNLANFVLYDATSISTNSFTPLNNINRTSLFIQSAQSSATPIPSSILLTLIGVIGAGLYETRRRWLARFKIT